MTEFEPDDAGGEARLSLGQRIQIRAAAAGFTALRGRSRSVDRRSASGSGCTHGALRRLGERPRPGPNGPGLGVVGGCTVTCAAWASVTTRGKLHCGVKLCGGRDRLDCNIAPDDGC